jgi:nicotinamidase-related amidase
MLIEAARSALLLIDLQERLAPAVAQGEACVARARILLEAARRLAVPVLATEQYPQGLGRTVEALLPLLAPEQVVAKVCFAGAADPAVAAALQALDRSQIVLCGMEAHVCVLQTALDLPRLGLQPVVVADAVASRRAASRDLALARLRANGVEVVDSEMVVFEWLARAGTDDFKALVRLIK